MDLFRERIVIKNDKDFLSYSTHVSKFDIDKLPNEMNTWAYGEIVYPIYDSQWHQKMDTLPTEFFFATAMSDIKVVFGTDK